MSQFTYRQLDQFDNTGLFSSANEKSYFPFHLHDTFCVTLITSGAEVLETNNTKLITEAGTISIIPPGEMHRNFSLTDAGYSYETFYLNRDILRYYNNGKRVEALERAIIDHNLSRQMHSLFVGDNMQENAWANFLSTLLTYSVTPENVLHQRKRFQQIDQFIEEQPRALLNNQWLARQFHLERQHFIRAFTREHGVTPQRYIQLRLLTKAKDLLQQQVPLQDIAYITGFHDPSHFTKSFKKVFGLSPSAFTKKSQ